MACPTCGREFATEQGMRQHHTKVHGEPLPNRTCSGCGTQFYDPKARLEYCEDCDPNAGKHNGNWQGKQESSTCRECGEEFRYYPSNKDGVYCSSCVDESDGILWENPAKEVERVSANCRQCGTEQQVLPSELERRKYGVFCDMECYGGWLSQNVVGENHHQWTEGESTYSHGWSKIQRAALVRDDHECQVCGKKKEEIGRNPDVHHIEPVREFDHPGDAHTSDNVICLCRSCHTDVEGDDISDLLSSRK